MHSVSQIRSKFLEFFEKNGHKVVSSSPLVPHNDPTLMFTNAGMVQFKDVFTQNETRNYKRAASSQKCVRAGGKHNDLDNVGYTARHHTFFEMLGNFSFGDYFKEGAIKLAWEFLTKELDISPDKLFITVYHTDDEAFDIWKKVSGFPDKKIMRVPTSDNFWSMGNTGPCGPCSEIFYDHGDKIEGKWQLDNEGNDLFGDRFIEIWNLVFMQYEKLPSGEQIDLPAPSIDTGMGLERMAAVMQGVHDNYDIDLFKSLIEAAQNALGSNDKKHFNSYRVIADHLRSVSFLLADGVMPSNEGRGYVLRRIMRRAMRHARQIGCKQPVIYKLVPALIKEMGEAYPELVRAHDLITEILKLEEERFGETLDRGLKLLDDETSSLKAGGTLSGEIAFKLYDTYGFPLDLTVDILRTKNIGVDEKGFSEYMAEQKKRARAAWKGSGEQADDEIWFHIKEEYGATEFLGYEATQAQAKVVAIITDGMKVDTIHKGAKVQIVLNQTPFYGESGGQEGDTGIIKTDEAEIVISDTKKYVGGLHAHIGKITKGEVKEHDVVTAIVDRQRRLQIRANHSATHILHAVLREILGEHVTQKGSLVSQNRLRFDISHPKAISAEDINIVETKVNNIIRQNSKVGTKIMKPEDAVKAGAMALFGEKYGDEVRVVNMGLDSEKDYSVELCGGTHVNRTGDIGIFKIVSESAIAAGIRRIEAVTAEGALEYIGETEKNLAKIAGLLKVAKEEAPDRIQALLDERKKIEKELAKARKDAAMGGGDSGSASEIINGISFIGKNFGDVPPKDLRAIVGDLQKQLGSGVIAVASSFEGKGSIIIAVTEDLTGKISAVDLVKNAAEELGAKGGGGKPNFAQTGGPNGQNVEAAIDKVRKAL